MGKSEALLSVCHASTLSCTFGASGQAGACGMPALIRVGIGDAVRQVAALCMVCMLLEPQESGPQLKGIDTFLPA